MTSSIIMKEGTPLKKTDWISAWI